MFSFLQRDVHDSRASLADTLDAALLRFFPAGRAFTIYVRCCMRGKVSVLGRFAYSTSRKYGCFAVKIVSEEVCAVGSSPFYGILVWLVLEKSWGVVSWKHGIM
jgi:hypothetical protein